MKNGRRGALYDDLTRALTFAFQDQASLCLTSSEAASNDEPVSINIDLPQCVFIRESQHGKETSFIFLSIPDHSPVCCTAYRSIQCGFSRSTISE